MHFSSVRLKKACFIEMEIKDEPIEFEAKLVGGFGEVKMADVKFTVTPSYTFNQMTQSMRKFKVVTDLRNRAVPDLAPVCTLDGLQLWYHDKLYRVKFLKEGTLPFSAKLKSYLYEPYLDPSKRPFRRLDELRKWHDDLLKLSNLTGLTHPNRDRSRLGLEYVQMYSQYLPDTPTCDTKCKYSNIPTKQWLWNTTDPNNCLAGIIHTLNTEPSNNKTNNLARKKQVVAFINHGIHLMSHHKSVPDHQTGDTDATSSVRTLAVIPTHKQLSL